MATLVEIKIFILSQNASSDESSDVGYTLFTTEKTMSGWFCSEVKAMETANNTHQENIQYLFKYFLAIHETNNLKLVVSWSIFSFDIMLLATCRSSLMTTEQLKSTGELKSTKDSSIVCEQTATYW